MAVVDSLAVEVVAVADNVSDVCVGEGGAAVVFYVVGVGGVSTVVMRGMRVRMLWLLLLSFL